MQVTRVEIKILLSPKDFIEKRSEMISILKELQNDNTLRVDRLEVQITEPVTCPNVSVKKVAEELSRIQKSRY